MTIVQALLLAIAGAGAGFLAGLVGVGGGVIFTPVLFAVYGVLNVPDGIHTPLTVGTGLFCTGLAAGASTFHHYRRDAVWPHMAITIGLGSTGAVGVVSYVVVTQPWYDATLFQLLFATLLLIVAGRMLVTPEYESVSVSTTAPTAKWGSWLGTGSAAGTVAAAVGVGGGIILVPAYNRLLGLPFHRAVGTSSATILLISGLSTGAYAWIGTGICQPMPFALGYVDVGTGLLLAGPAVVGAQVGVALAHRFNTLWLQRSFAVLAVLVAGRLLFGVLW